ncbi:hypothetical protein [Myxococcus virescens]|uniref:hypothetical protein n=1 Tax=Myxococcus virescens TaxID=83456 RepID=UPI001FC949C7|nr:hypothetical protein [Myxococcus virescens]
MLKHYRSGMVPSTTLDAAFLREGQPDLSLNDSEADALLAFLHVLTTERFLATEALSASQ